MLEQKSESFFGFFLEKFTEELIKNSRDEILRLQDVIEQEEKEIKKEVSAKIKKETSARDVFIPSRHLLMQRKSVVKHAGEYFPTPQPHFMPRKLPQRFPFAQKNTNEIDLEKINSFIKNPSIRSIECQGEGENILIRGAMGNKKTDVILSEEEISQIIKKFSETARMPIHDGVFKVAIKGFVLSAIISDIVGSRFIITKTFSSET